MARLRTSVWLAASALVTCATVAMAGRKHEAIPVLPPNGAVEVRVERVRPMKDKLATMRFLKDNRGFIRRRLDRLKQTLLERSGEGATIDPRFLAYQDLLSRSGASRDSVAAADAERERHTLLQSITELGSLERGLDQLDQILTDQRARLGVLQGSFTGDQRTELIVVLSGAPAGAAVSSITMALEDGVPRETRLGDDHTQALAHGGAVELFHGFVEPREQVVEIRVDGPQWPAGNFGYVTLDPPRDRLLLLHLDLSALAADRGAPSIRASAWLHEARVPWADN